MGQKAPNIKPKGLIKPGPPPAPPAKKDAGWTLKNGDGPDESVYYDRRNPNYIKERIYLGEVKDIKIPCVNKNNVTIDSGQLFVEIYSDNTSGIIIKKTKGRFDCVV